MIYITGDTHNTTDMSNLSSRNMKLCCMEQGVGFHDITYAIVLGGAMSEDKAWRVPHESWWPQEEWSEGEKIACLEKIAACGSQFDYVLSHTGPSAGIAETDDFFKNEKNMKELLKDSTVGFNDKVDEMIEYKKWFFGHWHSDWGWENKESKFVALYHQGILI